MKARKSLVVTLSKKILVSFFGNAQFLVKHSIREVLLQFKRKQAFIMSADIPEQCQVNQILSEILFIYVIIAFAYIALLPKLKELIELG